MRIFLLALATAIAAALGSAVLAGGAGATTSAQSTDSVIATGTYFGSGGLGYIDDHLNASLCFNPSIDTYTCVPTFGPLTEAAVGATTWKDATSPAVGPSPGEAPGSSIDFRAFVAYLTNGRPDWILETFYLGTASTGGAAISEQSFLGSSVGPNGLDLQGYIIDRIGLRIDALTISTPGSDPNGDGIWTDSAMRATVLFEGRPFNKDDCKDDGWRGYFENQGACIKFVCRRAGQRGGRGE